MKNLEIALKAINSKYWWASPITFLVLSLTAWGIFFLFLHLLENIKNKKSYKFQGKLLISAIMVTLVSGVSVWVGSSLKEGEKLATFARYYETGKADVVSLDSTSSRSYTVKSVDNSDGDFISVTYFTGEGNDTKTVTYKKSSIKFQEEPNLVTPYMQVVKYKFNSQDNDIKHLYNKYRETLVNADDSTQHLHEVTDNDEITVSVPKI